MSEPLQHGWFYCERTQRVREVAVRPGLKMAIIRYVDAQPGELSQKAVRASAVHCTRELAEKKAIIMKLHRDKS